MGQFQRGLTPGTDEMIYLIDETMMNITPISIINPVEELNCSCAISYLRCWKDIMLSGHDSFQYKTFTRHDHDVQHVV